MILFSFPRAGDGAYSSQLKVPFIGSWYPPPSYRGGPKAPRPRRQDGLGRRQSWSFLGCVSLLSLCPHTGHATVRGG